MGIVIKKRASIEAEATQPTQGHKSVSIPKEALQSPEVPLDHLCQRAIEKSGPNMMIPWFLMASYLYYKHHKSLLSDQFYDGLAKSMLDQWPILKHQHKALIKEPDLVCGSMFHLTDREYPNLVKGAAKALVEEEWGVKIEVKFWFDTELSR